MSNPELTRLRAAENAFEVAIRAMGQTLVDASHAAHEIAELDPPKDEQDAQFDRLLWLGKITDTLGVLCTPRLRMLAAILDDVVELEEPDETTEKPTRRTDASPRAGRARSATRTPSDWDRSGICHPRLMLLVEPLSAKSSGLPAAAIPCADANHT